MEPKNRPYVDPDMEPGDAGTEPWADDAGDTKAGDATKRGPLADPDAPSEEGVAINGSPADQFMTGDAVSAQDEDADEPEGD